MPRREHAVEKEMSWGIAKLLVDGGHAIDVSEVLAALEAAGAGVERAGACPSCEELFFQYKA
jgi:hypothetical protein